MVKSARVTARLILFLCAALTVGPVPNPAAAAGPLEGLTGPVKEAVEGPVGEVTETVGVPVKEATEAIAPPVNEVTETVTSPVKEATEPVAPAVKETTETVVRPVKEATETVAPPPVSVPPVKVPKLPSTQVPNTVSGTVSRPGHAVEGTVHAAAEGVVHGAKEAVTAVPADGGVDQAPSPAEPSASRNSGSTDAGSSVSTGAGSSADAGPPSVLSTSPTARPVHVRGLTFVPSPARDGSTGAPLPRWIAYIWPAVALTGPGFADLMVRWEQATLRVALGGDTGSGGGGGPVVAGVHASGGRPGASDSSSSPFSKIPAAIGHAFSAKVPSGFLVYLLIVALLVIAIFAAIRLEMTLHRR